MNIPAYASPNLRIGRSYNAQTSKAGIDIFPGDIKIEETNVNQFNFEYRVIKNTKDTKDLLNISGELSLKVKAGLVSVSGSGKYLSDNKKTGDTTEVLVVLKCLTVSETMRGLPKLAADVASGKFKHGLGTHYARSITYGGELVASLSIENRSHSPQTLDIQGSASGVVNAKGVDVSLKAQLEKLTSECSGLSDISIKYYSTDLPSKAPTNLDELVKLIEGFPSRLEKIMGGKGIPLQFELQPISTALQKEGPPVSNLPPFKEDQLEQYYDDLRAAQTRIDLYQESNVDEDYEVSSFSDEIEEVMEKFMQAINLIGSSGGLDKTIKSCFDAYHKALGGSKRAGKFCRKLEQIISKKKPIPPTTNITLPRGDPLTVVLIGKTGNGKSSVGNQILGQNLFGVSDGATSDTLVCTQQTRTKERKITVIDTPGVIDTKIVKQMAFMGSQAQYKAGFKKELETTLKELTRMFLLAPRGFNAILLLGNFGSRFTRDDNDALQMLLKFMTPDAKKYMILVLSHGDQAEYNASEKGIAVDKYLKNWIDKMDDCLKSFIHDDLKDRVVLFNCKLKPDKEPEAYKKQLCKLIEMIDKIKEERKVPFKTELTDRVKDAADLVEPENLEILEEKLKSCNRGLNEKGITKSTREDIERRKKEVIEKIEKKVNDAKKEIEKESGGCYPASATFVDVAGRRRQMESLLLGEEVQVITNKGVTSKPVITFIHRQPDLFQKFMQIKTLRYKKILKITEDHLIFVEKNGKEAAIPARDVKIGNMVYVKVGGQEMLQKDAVQGVTIVFERGVYAPVTLSGTILVNDVYTSCYFDVLSHVWFHRAMGAARAVYHLSPKMAEWISSIGEEDGFPGWCRLAHKLLLTWNDSS
ncbi:uncharacterized protein LOC114969765 [Acropora millepora]|uniref:uncharacterized protein LOC114969765 n=1 Tax=Acropora millepora TaxID=45264 RepID=UPI001CF4866B|nr:uncharacterized protein LOC114969765 [Acropora millepora]